MPLSTQPPGREVSFGQNNRVQCTAHHSESDLSNVVPINIGSSLIEFDLDGYDYTTLLKTLSELPTPYFYGSTSSSEFLDEYRIFLDSFIEHESIAHNAVADFISQNKVLSSRISDLKDNSSETSVVVLRNSPHILKTDELSGIATPDTHGKTVPNRGTFIAEWFLVGLSKMLGHAVSYPTLKNAQIVHQVCPDPSLPDSLSSAGFKAPLPPHTDRIADANSPDFLILSALRSDDTSRARTSVTTVSALTESLSEEDINNLEDKAFHHPLPINYSDVDNLEEYNEDSPILTRRPSWQL